MRTGLGGGLDRQSALPPGRGSECTLARGIHVCVGTEGAWQNALFELFNQRFLSRQHLEINSDFSWESKTGDILPIIPEI